mmetsp:Transcript_9380/g.20188  ORF Transcript_9380/g.20188 Transcript_9380/m.20188 type:complete len:256 (+) Transcript_9380:151-918(+)
MTEPTVKAVQAEGSQHSTFLERMGAFTTSQPQQHRVTAPPDLNISFVAPTTPNFVSRSNTTGHYQSLASSMDLMTPQGIAPPPQAQGLYTSHSHLFKSSSHHTSYSAAAGDLLTMSRRAFNPDQQSDQKKRHAAAADWNDGQTNVNANSNYFGIVPLPDGNKFNGDCKSCQNQEQGTFHPWHSMDMSDPKQSPLFNTQSHHETALFVAPVSTDGSTSTSSTMGGMSPSAGNDDLYQCHRTTRRCRRSDSFEMMDM